MAIQRSRREVLAGGGTAVLGATAGCLDAIPGLGEDEDEDDGLDRTLRMGVLAPLSGENEAVGSAIEKAVQLPADQLDEAREEADWDVSLNHDIEIKDTESSATVAVQAAKELTDAGYPAVAGAGASNTTLQAAQQVLIPFRVACCAPAATAPTMSVLNDIGLVYRTVTSDSLQADVLAEKAANEEGHASAATLYENTAAGLQLSRAFAQAFQGGYGGTITEQVAFERGAESYADQVATIREGGPELVVVVGDADDGPQLFEELLESGDETIYVTDSMRESALHDQIDHSIDGIRGTSPYFEGPGELYFADRFDHTYDEEPGPFATQAYDSAAILLLANAYAGQNDGMAISTAVDAVTDANGEEIMPSNLQEGFELVAQGEPIEYRGASNEIRFDENGDVTDATFDFWEFDSEHRDGVQRLDRVSL